MNRLAEESSPYLRQHADNPVDWYPWGDEAQALARELDRPIFLSIGYSVCHWCHVMAHESFEDARGRRADERAFRQREGRPRRTTRRRRGLHAGGAGVDRQRRLADERVAHARRPAVLRRHLLPAGRPPRHAVVSRACVDAVVGGVDRAVETSCSTPPTRSPVRSPARSSPSAAARPTRRCSRARSRACTPASTRASAGSARAPKFPPAMALAFLCGRAAIDPTFAVSR